MINGQLTGAQLIADERREQIRKHNRTLKHDSLLWTEKQLKKAAKALLQSKLHTRLRRRPSGFDTPLWVKICNKPEKERLVIAGAFLAAEIDRITLSNTKED